MTNTNLWEKVQNFEFDNPNEPYGFSTRLTFENAWTIHFTQSAILEYKKFMYLAATQNHMVSPSETVDKVWHQHLIFTKSYTDLCDILGKRVEHIPSTHKFSEKETFAQAARKTKVFYEANFGKQPAEIWNFHDPMDSLGLSRFKADKVNSYFKIGFAFSVAFFALFPRLRPWIEKIQNPDFLIYYVILFGTLLVGMEIYVKSHFVRLFFRLEKNVIISNLHVFELICMKHDQLEYVMHGVVNRLVKRRIIDVRSRKILLKDSRFTGDEFEDCIIGILRGNNGLTYPVLLRMLRVQYIFKQFHGSLVKLKETIVYSTQVMRIKHVCFAIFCLWFLIGICRIATGMLHGKPIAFLVVVLVLILMTAVFYIKRINSYFTKNTIPSQYRKEITNEQQQDWKWNYLVAGKAVFALSFMSMIRQSENMDNPGGSCGSACGSSCGGGSCGSGCGGCGGD